jgi:hypothetical protein
MHTLSYRGTFLVLENADSSPSSCAIPIAGYSFFLTFKLPSPIRHLGDIGIVIDVGLVTIPFLVLILTVCGVRMLSMTPYLSAKKIKMEDDIKKNENVRRPQFFFKTNTTLMF